METWILKQDILKFNSFSQNTAIISDGEVEIKLNPVYISRRYNSVINNTV